MTYEEKLDKIKEALNDLSILFPFMVLADCVKRNK